MKKFLKRVGVFGLICAVLSPFATIPKVNAAEDCEHYLNQYLFLDVTNGNAWTHYETDEGYRTYTTFLYTFPEITSGQTIRIDKVGEQPLEDSNGILLDNYRSQVLQLINDDDRSINLTNRIGNEAEYNYSSQDYKSKTAILHGYWNNESQNSYEKVDYSEISDNLKTETKFRQHTIQHVIDQSNKNISLDVNFSGARLSNNKFTNVYSSEGEFDDFFQQVVTDISTGANDNSTSIEKDYVWKADANSNNYYINLGIRRMISESDLNKLNFGYVSETSNDEYYGYIYSTSTSSITNSYDALISHENEEQEGAGNWVAYGIKEKSDFEEQVDIDTATYYYWPVVLNVEYSICSNTNDNVTPDKEKWTLKYDDNVNDSSVTNMPDPLTEIAEVGKSLKVSDRKPKREGYAFNGWKLCNGTDTYKAGDEITSNKTATIELCAQWGQGGTTDNPKQGVISYVIGFASVGAIAGAIYLISKKKNLFKQI